MRLLLTLPIFALAALSLAQPAKHRVVIEVSVPGTVAYRAVLGNAQNLIRAFSPEKVEVEIVCLGAGIDMLFPDRKAISAQLMKVHNSGVTFAACSNTMVGRHLTKKNLYSFVTVVDSGVAEVVRKQEAGWSYLKGAY